jgi:hypothetical protein
MKLLHAPLLLLALAPIGREEITLRYAPEPGTRITRTFVAVADYELADLELSIEGESVEAFEELPEYALHFVERIVVTDELVAVEDGRTSDLVRTFDELSQESTFSTAEDEQTQKSGSPFEGRTLRFTWDPDEEEYDITADDDAELSDSLAEWLREDMDLRLVLPPEGEVEVGDEWELDPDLYLAFMGPGGLLDFRDEGEEDVTDEERAGSRQTIENLAGSGTATLEALREEDGVQVAVIRIELDIETGSTSEPAEGVTVEVEIERTLTGTILWDVEHGHALSAELEAEASRLVTTARTLESEEGPVDVEEAELMEGTIRYTATFERE